MVGWRKACWWGLAALGAGVAVGLLVWVSAADLERSSQAWGVAGSLAGILALGVALRQLKASMAAAPPVLVPPEGPGLVRAEGGSNAAGESIRNSQARDTAPQAGPAPGPAPEGPGISASGGSNAAVGDIDGSTAHRGP